MLKPRKQEYPHSSGLPHEIQIEIRVIRSHLQIDSSGELWSNPPGGGCHTLSTMYGDISQHVFSLVLRGASAIGLRTTQRNNSISHLHPMLRKPKIIKAMHPWLLYPHTIRANFLLGLSPDLICELRGWCTTSAAPSAVCSAKPKQWVQRNRFLHYFTE